MTAQCRIRNLIRLRGAVHGYIFPSIRSPSLESGLHERRLSQMQRMKWWLVRHVPIIFRWIVPGIFCSGDDFTKTLFHFRCFFCLYGILSIANYSNQQIWSVRTRIGANMVQKRMLRALLKWSPEGRSKVHTRQIRNKFFRIAQKTTYLVSSLIIKNRKHRRQQ